MRCSKHLDREPVGMCVKCNKFVCEECAVTVNNRIYCKECIADIFSNNTNVNTEKIKQNVKEYADKAVDTTVDITNESLNLVKDFTQSEEVKNTIDTAKKNSKLVNLVLGIISIALMVPTIFSNIISIPYIFDELIFTMRYYGTFRFLTYTFNVVVTLIQPLVIILLATLLIKEFIKVNRTVKIIAPIAITVIFTLIRFITLKITFTYINFNFFADMFVYIIPVILIIIGNLLDKEEVVYNIDEN